MTLIFGQNQGAPQPQTHVLIIGVGRYPYLLGGTGRPTPGVPPLGQLKSPPVSARAVADWFTGGANAGGSKHYNPHAPLGSVEILLADAASQQYPTPAGMVQVDDATMGNVEQSFNAWDMRCHAHDDNIAIFYFCGHGLEKDVPVLLPEDFGRNPNAKWTSAIDFQATFRGMAGCRAKTQVYVVDSCRQWSRSMLENLNTGGRTLKDQIVGNQQRRTAPVLFASANGLQAFGDTGGVSRLTSAFIDCLNGGGADRRNGKWFVDAARIGEAVQKLVQQRNADLKDEDRQFVDNTMGENSSEGGVLHELKEGDVPVVAVTCRCEPAAATEHALFYAKRQLKGKRRKDAPKPGPWSVPLVAGVYTIGVDFPGGEYPGRALHEEPIRPPISRVALPVALEVD